MARWDQLVGSLCDLFVLQSGRSMDLVLVDGSRQSTEQYPSLDAADVANQVYKYDGFLWFHSILYCMRVCLIVT
jgi:hypothetical protein